MDWKFKDDALPCGSSNGFWYDITDGGYIVPRELLSDDFQLQEVEHAVYILRSFQRALEDESLLIEF